MKSTTTSVAGQVSTTTVDVPARFTGGDKASFCAAFTDVVRISGDALAKAHDPASIRAEYAKLGDVIRRLKAASPKEITEQVGAVLTVNDQVVSSGNLDAFKADKNQRNVAVITKYAAANCK